MAKLVSLSVTLVLLGLALLSAWLWQMRAALPYNESGRFYDAAEGVVYEDSAVVVYAMLALVFIALAMASTLLTARLWRRRT